MVVATGRRPLRIRRRAVTWPRLSTCAVFFDFVNTITQGDILDDIVRRFSINDEWMATEAAWVAGTIGSKECLELQLRGVRVTNAALSRYLTRVKLDPQFKRLIAFLSGAGIDPVILSDNFSSIVHRILQYHGLTGITIYANRLRFAGNRLIPSFPYQDRWCTRQCAHCKGQHLTSDHVSGKTRIYIGDGRSDLCAAAHAEIVFAKGQLLDYLRETKRSHVAFQTLKDVYACLKKFPR